MLRRNLRLGLRGRAPTSSPAAPSTCLDRGARPPRRLCAGRTDADASAPARPRVRAAWPTGWRRRPRVPSRRRGPAAGPGDRGGPRPAAPAAHEEEARLGRGHAGHAQRRGSRASSTSCRDERLRLAVGRRSTTSAHWITPRGAPRRYDTRFFVAAGAARPGRRSTTTGETVATVWVAARTTHWPATAGEIDLIFPTMPQPRGHRPLRHQRRAARRRRGGGRARCPTMLPRVVPDGTRHAHRAARAIPPTTQPPVRRPRRRRRAGRLQRSRARRRPRQRRGTDGRPGAAAKRIEHPGRPRLRPRPGRRSRAGSTRWLAGAVRPADGPQPGPHDRPWRPTPTWSGTAGLVVVDPGPADEAHTWPPSWPPPPRARPHTVPSSSPTPIADHAPGAAALAARHRRRASSASARADGFAPGRARRRGLDAAPHRTEGDLTLRGAAHAGPRLGPPVLAARRGARRCCLRATTSCTARRWSSVRPTATCISTWPAWPGWRDAEPPIATLAPGHGRLMDHVPDVVDALVAHRLGRHGRRRRGRAAGARTALSTSCCPRSTATSPSASSRSPASRCGLTCAPWARRAGTCSSRAAGAGHHRDPLGRHGVGRPRRPRQFARRSERF